MRVEAELQLSRHFAGKRNGARIERKIDLVAEGHDRRYLVRSINISRSGMLLSVPDGDLFNPVDAARFVDNAGRASKEFRWGIMLCIGNFRCRAIVVRVIRGDVIQLGCRFCMRLPRKMCDALRIPDTDDGAA